MAKQDLLESKGVSSIASHWDDRRNKGDPFCVTPQEHKQVFGGVSCRTVCAWLRYNYVVYSNCHLVGVRFISGFRHPSGTRGSSHWLAQRCCNHDRDPQTTRTPASSPRFRAQAAGLIIPTIGELIMHYPDECIWDQEDALTHYLLSCVMPPHLDYDQSLSWRVSL